MPVVKADLQACQGYANCVVGASDYFDLDDDGIVVLLQTEVPEADRARVTDAGLRGGRGVLRLGLELVLVCRLNLRPEGGPELLGELAEASAVTARKRLPLQLLHDPSDVRDPSTKEVYEVRRRSRWRAAGRRR